MQALRNRAASSIIATIMLSGFAAEFFWKSLRDYRAWIGVIGLALAAFGGVTGKPTILPTWGWTLVAFASALSMAIRAEWKGYQDANAKIEPDMKLIDVVKRIVRSNDIFVGENCGKTGDALLTIRERGHLGQIAVWGRRDVLTEDMDLYPRAPIPPEYWDEFGIDYLKFVGDQRGESKRVRGHTRKERVKNTTTTAIHVVRLPDVIYRDFWFSAHQIVKFWSLPKRRIKLQWPISK